MSTSSVLEVGGFTLERHSVAEVCRIPDLELGRLLGYSRPRDIRDLIERHRAVLPAIHQRGTVARCEIRPGQWIEQPGSEYLLAEEEALFIAARSETATGAAVLKKLIEVFMLARRGLLAEAQGASGAPGLSAEQVAVLASRVAAQTCAAMMALPAARRACRRILASQAEANPVAEFLASTMRPGESARARDLYERFRAWSAEQHLPTDALTPAAFGRRAAGTGLVDRFHIGHERVYRRRAEVRH